MKGKTIVLLGTMAFLSMLFPVAAYSESYGFYSWTRSWPTVGVPGFIEDYFKDYLPTIEDVRFELRHDHFTLGYLYDSAPTQDTLFFYRFSLGVDIALAGLNNVKGGGISVAGIPGSESLASALFDATGFGFVTKFVLGVRLLRTEDMRVWVGPAVRINALYLDQKKASLDVAVGSSTYQVQIDPWGAAVSAGGGIEGGINYRLSPELTLDFSTGFDYGFFGVYQKTGLKIASTPVPDDSSFFWGEEPSVFVQLAVMFTFQ